MHWGSLGYLDPVLDTVHAVHSKTTSWPVYNSPHLLSLKKRRGAFNYSYGPEQLSSGKQFATEKNIIVIAKSSISSGFYRVCMITFWCLPSGTLWHSYGKWMKMAHLYQGWWFSTVLFVYQRVIFPLGQSIEIYSIVFFSNHPMNPMITCHKFCYQRLWLDQPALLCGWTPRTGPAPRW